LITTLTSKMWERRGKSGEAIWLVEFYSPWCKHCQTYVATWKGVAQLLVNDNVEVAAVNCEAEKDMCAKVFNIRSYPTVRMINKKHGTQQELSAQQRFDVDSVAEWARRITVEWTWLFKASNVTYLNAESFNTSVVASRDFWVVGMVDGVECDKCKTTMTNMMRLSAGTKGRASVGVFNCDASDEDRQFCDSLGCPAPPHSPEVRVWPRGPKNHTVAGEVAYNANDLDPHIALELMDRIVRLARADDIDINSVAEGGQPNWEEDENPPPDPPEPPKPEWNGPRGRPNLAVNQGPSAARQSIGTGR